MGKIKIDIFQNKLLHWYDKNARILPWREDATPYRVWISEIMLQQTRVEAVKPYYDRFMNEIKNVQELANIDEDKLLKLWEGLGYYNRARNLKKAAQRMMEQYDGAMPSHYSELLQLPGIGPYTAGAVASISFGEKVPAIDGNVVRVIARIIGNRNDIKQANVKKELEETVVSLLPNYRIGDFNQALMELGATICLPNGSPKCGECPLKEECYACQNNLTDVIPMKQKQKERRIENRTIFVMNDQNKIAIRKRVKEGLLANLYEFPNVMGHLSEKEARKQLNDWGVEHFRLISLNPSKHIFSHIEWHMIGYLVLIQNKKDVGLFSWKTKEEILDKISIPVAFQEYVAYIKKLRT